MPPVRLLTRSSTPKSRGRQIYDVDDDDDDDSEKERLRGRLRSRSRVTWGTKSRATSRAKSKVKSRPTSRSSESADSITIPTPTRSSYVHVRSAPSAPSLGSSSGSSTEDSDDASSNSTQDYRMKTRTLKERMNGTPDSEPVPNPPSRSQSRHRSRDRIVPEIESATDDSEDQVVISHRPRVVVKRSSQSRRRQALQSRSPSRAPSPKRTAKKYYQSDVTYAGKPPLPRSRATSTSRVTPSHSMSSSSVGKFFQTSSLPQSYDASSQRANCQEWIRPADHRHHSNGRTSATCRKCKTDICGDCYNKWHKSRHCPADPDTAQFLKVAEEAGWKRCFNCQAMVELKEGCNHMTCRCGAQFCMLCGSKWKACECPSFNYHLNGQDGLDHVRIHVPMVSRERLGGTDGLPRSSRPGLGYAPESRRHPGHRDDRRRLQHADDDDDDFEEDDDDDYLDDMDDAMGIGNAAGHFMNDVYRRRAHSAAGPPVAPPAVPLPPPSLTHERPNSGANYVSGVNKARGVRSSSMERRLADRFSEQRQNVNPHHRAFGQPIHPPTAPPMGMGHPPLHQPPMVPSLSRRHTMDDDMYDIPFDPRYASQSIPRRAHTYMDDFAVHAPMGRRRYRQMEPPKPSELAGLTGPGSGMNRVYEWVNHVDPYPDSQTVA
ncbi:hypothetical protein E0Z10_g9088 [Xylaria hypoxylon]|uniref:RBR-type E3 ubiquitin transferase n=1 Tax=Xylaria hypoxylon TaxID=37992 RepID=A0A4Z0Y9P1_9PEZI|nr:hypothetical protein E0Z10_g9088 [Xylaria hypoxylon]